VTVFATRPHLVPLFLAFALASCSVNPFRTAQTLEQKADALYGSFVIAQKQGVALVRDPTVSDGIKRAIAEADAVAKPVADELYAAVIEYAAARRAFRDGTLTEQEVQSVALRLNALITSFAPLVMRLKAAGTGDH
jgi:hypothetical protein